MPRRPPVALGLALLLSACSTGDDGAVPVEPVASLSTAADAACASLVAALPAEIAPGVRRRAVEPDRGTTAAWGDPAVVLRCGTEEGSERDDLYDIDAVRWAMHDVGSARRWRTVDRRVNVEVVVPDEHSAHAEMLGRLGTALAATA